MATTFVDYTGDGNATKSFSFPSYKVEDIKVEVDNVIKTVTTHYNITSYTTTGGGNVVFTSGNIPASPAAIRIFRDTDVDSAKATFTAGSSVKADDLNNNMTQILYAAQEEQNQTVLTSDIKDAAVTTDKIKDANITTSKIANDAVTNAKIADGTVVSANIASNAITTDKIADDNVTLAKLGSGALPTDITVATANITDSNVTTAKIADSNVTTAKIADDAVTAAKLASSAVVTASIVDGNVTTAKLAADAVTAAKLADDAVVTANIVNANVTTAKIADGNITAAKIASNAVTTDKIADSELTTLAGMQSGTASKLADSTALTADIADLNQIDGMAKQTTISDDDTKFPTSGAVVDYVAAQLEPFGGFEAIANESSFPNTQPASGVVISIADAGGMSVSGSGTASGATVGGTTVNITGIASNFNGTTITTGVRFLVVSTGSGQNYTYHKATLREDDLASLSGDINDFSERYRVGASNPTTSLDNGDLFFNTGSGKLLVYNGTNSAWEETQSVGNFFINTISSSSATGGGSATANGTAYRFTLSNAGASAPQHLVSVDGVVQKPNSGTSQPSEGFAIDGGDIIFGSAPVNGASLFVITIGASVSIGTPSNNTVTTAILQNGSVTTAKITDANVTTAKIADDAVTAAKLASSAVVTASIVDDNVTTAKIADDAVTAAKLANTSVSAGSYGSSTSIPSITVDAQGRITAASGNSVNTDLVGDSSPQLGGNLDTNGNDIIVTDSNLLKCGTGGDLLISHNGTDSTIQNLTGNLRLRCVSELQVTKSHTENMAKFIPDGAVELYHDNVKKFETTSTGSQFSGQSGSPTDVTILGFEGYDAILNLSADEGDDNADKWRILSSTDGSFYLQNYTSGSWEKSIKATGDGSTDLYYNNSKKLETTDTGIDVTNDVSLPDNGVLRLGNIQGGDLKLYHDTTDSIINNKTGNFKIGNSHSGGNIIFYSSNTNRWHIDGNGDFIPDSNNAYDIGSSSSRVANIYTNDLHLSNIGHSNDVDGTWGDWTIQEGESDLFLKNNRSGKKYKFNLTEVA